MSEPKYTYRLPPCADYDIPAMESWLENMAAKGLHLSCDGFFLGLAAFEKGAPRREKFRLEPTTTNGGLLSEEYSPDDDAVQMNRQMGWTYRARRGQFHIYSSSDPDAPELHTDPQVQALTIGALGKYLRKSLTGTLIVSVIDYFLLFSDILISASIAFGTGKVLLLISLLLWDLGRRVRTILVLAQWRKQLQNGEPMAHHRHYRQNAWLHPSLNAVRMGLWVFLIGAFLAFGAASITEERAVRLEDYREAFPFPTLAEIYPGSEVDRRSGILDSQVTVWSDFLAPENYDFSEYAEVTLEGERFDCYLSLNYHRTLWDWTARLLAGEFVSQSGANPVDQTLNRLFGQESVTVTELSVPGADYCAYYYLHRDQPWIVLQKDNVVLRINLDILGTSGQMAPEELARVFLSRIR